MLIAYEPNSDVLTITLEAAPVAQNQLQGSCNVGFDANGRAVSVAIAEASTLLWEHGGQVQIALPLPASGRPATIVETTIVAEPLL